MTSQLFWLLVFLLLLVVLIGISELLHRKFKVKPEQSRKFLHVSGGLMCLLFPSIFSSHWWLLALVTIAFIILLITYKRKILPSVHQTKRYSIGSVLFPIPVYLCFVFAEWQQNSLFYYIPISLLAIADTAAEIGGSLWGHLTKKFFGGQKTLAGTLCFLITSVIVCLIWLNIVSLFPVQEALKITFVISVSTAIAETITLHGWDNLSVPAVAIALLWIFL
ncbi:MAG TPA: phosphatidate cytidylyltransferase [Chitinophagaceae bacterium]|nr:phosphatidate cytidylyltransferase [Chitinophagaceae bacterium]